MEITDPDLVAYLNHRAGEQRINARKRRMFYKALELNRPAPDFSSTFGKDEVPAYVGFIDLKGFSTDVHGKRPCEVAAYLKPFLGRVIDILRGHGILIDKTIGDEIMFVLAETEEEQQLAEILTLGQAMGGLHDLAFELQGKYKYRIGLAYGHVSFFHIDGTGYSEWTAVGEVVQLAKRLHSLKQLENPNPVCGAFAMSVDCASLKEIHADMQQRLSILAGFASRFGHELLPDPVEFKGVGRALCALLLARPEMLV
jgi:class 3 adenylate cyclase